MSNKNSKLDAERAGFEAWCLTIGYTLKPYDSGNGYKPGYGSELWSAWQARASRPVGVPDVLFDGFAVLSALSDKAKARTSAGNVSDVLDAVVKLIRDEAAPTVKDSLSVAPTVKAEQVQAMPQEWWQIIHDTLRNYRMSTLDDGYGGGYPLIDAMTADGQSVAGGIEECTYLADAIWNALPTQAPSLPVKAEQVDDDQAYDRNAERLTAEALGTGAGINMAATSIDELFDQTAPSLPDAGSAVEEVELVGYATPGQLELRNLFKQYPGMRIKKERDERYSEPLMTVAQHERIVAALSAQQSAPEQVSVPVASEYPKVGWTKRHKHTCANVQPGATAADKCDCGAVEQDKSREAIERAIHLLQAHAPSMGCAEWDAAEDLRALLAQREREGE